MLKPVRTVAPSVEVVTVAELKAQTRVDFSSDDAVLQAILNSAISHIDGYSGVIGRALVSQTWAVSADDFCDVMRLPLGDVIAVTSVQYYDTNGDAQTASASLYGVYTDALGPFIELKANQSWPSVDDRRDAVTITWTCGYGAAASNVPAAIRHAIMLLAAHWYENREASTEGGFEELPLGVKSLLLPFRQVGT